MMPIFDISVLFAYFTYFTPYFAYFTLDNIIVIYYLLLRKVILF